MSLSARGEEGGEAEAYRISPARLIAPAWCQLQHTEGAIAKAKNIILPDNGFRRV